MAEREEGTVKRSRERGSEGMRGGTWVEVGEEKKRKEGLRGGGAEGRGGDE